MLYQYCYSWIFCFKYLCVYMWVWNAEGNAQINKVQSLSSGTLQSQECLIYTDISSESLASCRDFYQTVFDPIL